MKPDRVAERKLDGFDGLRALAALSVVTYHLALSGAFAHAGSLAPLLWELKGGVAIFFVISGALLYLPYARAIRDGGALPDWRIYARRRGVRILPAYWVALTAVAIGPFGAGVFGPGVGSYYGLSQIYNSADSSRRAGRGLEPLRRGELLRAAAGVRLAGGTDVEPCRWPGGRPRPARVDRGGGIGVARAARTRSPAR